MKIINFFKLTKEEIIQELDNFFDPKRFSNKELLSEELISLQSKLKYFSNEHIFTSIMETLEKEIKDSLTKINDLENELFKEHLFNLFYFLEYLAKTENNMIMVKDQYDYSVININGDFSSQLWKFSDTITGLNVIFFYNDTNQDIPFLKFKDHKADIKTIQNYFLGEIFYSEFESIYNEYLIEREKFID